MKNQCRGITKSGKRCKITSGLNNGFCRLHLDQVVKKEKSDNYTDSVNQKTFPDYPDDDSFSNSEKTFSLKGKIIIFFLLSMMFLFFAMRKK